ncbi:hypothetical protein J6590_043700 [Homalodisca vitripennis]|nr:hypothetical protein J6590_043700 [Homalodisca vitripennis]
MTQLRYKIVHKTGINIWIAPPVCADTPCDTNLDVPNNLFRAINLKFAFGVVPPMQRNVAKLVTN